MKKTIKTYCYGELHEFPSIKKAMEFYFEGMQCCEGAERDQYTDIYTKLANKEEPFCDCDGVPAPKKPVEPLTEDEIKRGREIMIERDKACDVLDALRAKYDKLLEEFNKEHADLLADIDKANDHASELFYDLLALKKRGFKA